MKRLLAIPLALALAGGFLLSGCGKKEETASGPVAMNGLEKHTTQGVIKGFKGETTILIEHKDFPGEKPGDKPWMEGMMMGFEVKDKAMKKGLKEGDKVEFTIANESQVWPIVAIKKTGK